MAQLGFFSHVFGVVDLIGPRQADVCGRTDVDDTTLYCEQPL